MKNEHIQKRREHLLGLLVYFPELREISSNISLESPASDTLYSLLVTGDEAIIASISREQVDHARELLSKSFDSDYPVGF